MTSHDYNNDDMLDEYNDIDSHINNRMSTEYNVFNEFLDTTKYVVDSKVNPPNIWEQGGAMRCFNFPKEVINKFFTLYEKCRVAGTVMHFTEKQTAESSGIRYDLDIYQGEKNMKSLLTSDLPFNKFVNKFAKLFAKIFDIPAREFNVLVVIEVKPKVMFDEKKKQYKDGVHINIPSLKISRKAKRYLLKEILNKKIMTDCFGKDYGDITDPEEFIDKQSCHVPLLLFGSVKNGVKYPYVFKTSYFINYDSNKNPTIIQNNNFTTDKYNMALEISSCFDGEKIEKIHVEPRDEYIVEVDAWETRNRIINISEDQLEETINDMNHLTVNDPDTAYIYKLLDILKPYRYNDNKSWFKVVSALVNGGDKYIPFAKWFSQKSERYINDDDFNKTIDSIKKNNNKNGFNTQHILWWAKEDNSEKYDEINRKALFHKLFKMITDEINEGKLGHAHFAELAIISVKNKYVTDYKGNNSQRKWYEFKFPEDKMKMGQVYKWVEINHPDALDRYLSNKLHTINLKLVLYLKKQMLQKADNKNLAAYYKALLRNFKSSCRCLHQDNYKESILRQMQKMLVMPGFIDNLDKDEMYLGVAQGVLMLSQYGYKPKLIKSFHTIKISRYTSTSYYEFNPKEPNTRKLLKAYRGMFPDKETDAFEYYMGAHAASIDNRPRETIIFLITGGGANGKSAFEEMHAAALGDQYCTPLPINMLLDNGRDDNGENPSSFFMKLETARSAYYEEGPTLAVLKMSMVKKITGCATLPGREMHEKARTFDSRCYHFVLSNHDFEIKSFEEATMRRLRYIQLKITFKDELDYNPDDPDQRLKDHSFDASMRNKPEFKSAYLSIMTFFHMKLMHYHGGRIDNIPHETIDRDTLSFRNRQDHLNRFISTRIVKRVPLLEDSTEKYEPTSIENIVQEYKEWYSKNVKDTRHFDIKKSINDSVLRDHLFTKKGCDYLKAEYRVVPTGEMPDDDELLLEKVDKKGKVKKYSMKYKKETPDQALDRFEREWNELCELNSKQSKLDINMTDAFDGASDDEESRDIEVPKFKSKKIIKDDYDFEEDDVTREIEKDMLNRAVDDMGFTDDEYNKSDSGSDSDNNSKKKIIKSNKKIIKSNNKKIIDNDSRISRNESVSDSNIYNACKFIMY